MFFSIHLQKFVKLVFDWKKHIKIIYRRHLWRIPVRSCGGWKIINTLRLSQPLWNTFHELCLTDLCVVGCVKLIHQFQRKVICTETNFFYLNPQNECVEFSFGYFGITILINLVEQTAYQNKDVNCLINTKERRWNTTSEIGCTTFLLQLDWVCQKKLDIDAAGYGAYFSSKRIRNFSLESMAWISA